MSAAIQVNFARRVETAIEHGDLVRCLQHSELGEKEHNTARKTVGCRIVGYFKCVALLNYLRGPWQGLRCISKRYGKRRNPDPAQIRSSVMGARRGIGWSGVVGEKEREFYASVAKRLQSNIR